MSWEKVQLGDLIDVKHGYPFDSRYYADAGEYVLLTPGNCYESGGFKQKGDKEKYYVGEIPDRYLLSREDLLIVMTDLVNSAPVLGGSFCIPEDNKFLHNQRLGLVEITSPNRLDKRFLFHLLNTHDYRAQIRGSASGATVRHTAPGRIRECVVRIPQDIGYQRSIASTIDAYDDLIENNRRRMALLEESARLLYQEWFVHLRFPGHEHVRITEGLPEGWERVALEEALVLQRGFDLPTQDRREGSVPIYGSTGIVGHHDEAKTRGPGVVTGRSGTLGQVHYVTEDFWPLNTALWVKEFKRVSPLFALFLLKALDLRQFNGGASVPTLDRKAAHRVTILLPLRQLITDFTDLASDIFEQINNLNLQNQKLRTARDLLLPRLMSGEISV